MAERCPYCGLSVVGALPTHIAFSQPCQADQIRAVLNPDQPLITGDEPA